MGNAQTTDHNGHINFHLTVLLVSSFSSLDKFEVLKCVLFIKTWHFPLEFIFSSLLEDSHIYLLEKKVATGHKFIF